MFSFKLHVCNVYFLDAVRYVQDILNQILQGIQVTNIETYITLSEQIMDEVRMRNFSMENEAAMDELQNATLCKLLRVFWSVIFRQNIQKNNFLKGLV